MTDHYFSRTPGSKPRYQHLDVTLRGQSLRLTTGSGIFSKDHIDKGTHLLIASASIEGSFILDLGCGYGPVGLSLAKAYPSAHVTLSDVNERAVKITRKNAKDNGIHNVTVLQSDIYQGITGKFSEILLNPPQTAGKAICQAMIAGAIEHLQENGSLQIVARHNIGGKTLSEYMGSVFGNVDVLAKKSGFRVYRSFRESPAVRKKDQQT
ncbi:MAG: methyltransferase [Candidatus Woesearchaeota archaeon]